MSEPSCGALFYSGADCLSALRTYLPGTVLQWCKLFKQCRNISTRHCVTMVQAFIAVSEPTCRALCYSGADCLSSVRTYLLVTVLQRCRLFKQCHNLPAGCLSCARTYLRGTVLQWCRLFKQCLSLISGHCVTGMQTV